MASHPHRNSAGYPAYPSLRPSAASVRSTSRPPSRGAYSTSSYNAPARPTSAIYGSQGGRGSQLDLSLGGTGAGPYTAGGGRRSVAGFSNPSIYGAGTGAPYAGYGQQRRAPHDWSRLPPKAIARIMYQAFASCDPVDPLDWTSGIGGAKQQAAKGAMFTRVARVCKIWKKAAESIFYNRIAVSRASQLAFNQNPVVGSLFVLTQRNSISGSIRSMSLSFTPRRYQECHELLGAFLDVASRLQQVTSITLDFTNWPANEAPHREAFAALASLPLVHLAIIRCPSLVYLSHVLASRALENLLELELALRPDQRLPPLQQPRFRLTTFRLAASHMVWLSDGAIFHTLLGGSWNELEEVGITVFPDRGTPPMSALHAGFRMINFLAQNAPNLSTLTIKDDFDPRDQHAKAARQQPLPDFRRMDRLHTVSLLGVVEPMKLLRAIYPGELMELHIGGPFIGVPNDYAGMLTRRAFPYLRRFGVRQPYGWTTKHMRNLKRVSATCGIDLAPLYALAV